jgi:hypothetical protein
MLSSSRATVPAARMMNCARIKKGTASLLRRETAALSRVAARPGTAQTKHELCAAHDGERGRACSVSCSSGTKSCDWVKQVEQERNPVARSEKRLAVTGEDGYATLLVAKGQNTSTDLALEL